LGSSKLPWSVVTAPQYKPGNPDLSLRNFGPANRLRRDLHSRGEKLFVMVTVIVCLLKNVGKLRVIPVRIAKIRVP
jgi:hypothetical protein